jgi:hypothetical protein
MMGAARTALLIRCSLEEAGALRAQARSEHRTISGCVLNIMERSLWIEQQYRHGITPSFNERIAREFRLRRPKTERTSLLLRCSAEEAGRIRIAARNRQMSISDFIVFSVRRQWDAAEKLRRSGAVAPGR